MGVGGGVKPCSLQSWVSGLMIQLEGIKQRMVILPDLGLTLTSHKFLAVYILHLDTSMHLEWAHGYG